MTTIVPLSVFNPPPTPPPVSTIGRLNPAIIGGPPPAPPPPAPPRFSPIVPLPRPVPQPVPRPGQLSPVVIAPVVPPPPRVPPPRPDPAALRVRLMDGLKRLFPGAMVYSFSQAGDGFQIRIPLMIDPSGRYMAVLINRRSVFDSYLRYRAYYYVAYGSSIYSTSLPGSPSVPLHSGYESGVAVETVAHPLPAENTRLSFYPGGGRRVGHNS